MIVMKDADLERAARGAVWGAFMSTGQSCASIERVYVAREIAGAFTDRVLELTKAIRVGDPLASGTEIGPMVTSGQRDVVEDHIREAREKGASVLCGGERLADFPGYFLTPAVLTGVDHRMKIMKEETFGPVCPIMPFDAEDEALALANDCLYGLTASVWTRNRTMAARMAERLEAGTVTVNDHMFSFTEPQAIWGGVKQTGMGRNHGPYGLLHLQNIKFVSHDYIRKKGQFWWFPYADPKPQAFDNVLQLFHHERVGRKLKALWSLLPAMPIFRAGVSASAYPRVLARFFRKKMG
jgi:acyl-CoA reductase-like NAD-dependent aldehyde dehydrogenase